MINDRNPRISVVLTTYNRADVLFNTIEDILAQTEKNFELIVCDDHSPDGTESVVRDFMARDARIRYHRGVKNVGMPGNLNAGLLLARGDYIANIHDGDRYAPDLLAEWSQCLDRHPRMGFVFNQYQTLDSKGAPLKLYTESLDECTPGFLVLERYFFRNRAFTSPIWGTVMARRECYLPNSLFDSRFGFYSDVDMWMRLLETYDVGYVSKPLITLPGRILLPRQWKVFSEDAILSRMFWEARMRHYKSPISKFSAALTHFAFFVHLKPYRLACIIWRTLRRSVFLNPARSAT